MTTTKELLSTFEELALSMRANADEISKAAIAQGIPLANFQVAIDSLHDQAALADTAAEALRNGDAVSIHEL